MTAEQDPIEEEPSFSDDEGFKETIKDDELIGDVLREKPSEAELVEEASIIVDGIPVVNTERLSKLKNVLNKVFAKFGEIRLEHYPLDASEQTLGYCFVNYASKESAKEAASVLNGYSLDKSHTFLVNLATDLAKYDSIDDNWVRPTPRIYKDIGNLRWWLDNPKCADQYVIQFEEDKVAIHWNAPQDVDPFPIQLKQRWTETVVQWSAQGSYMATFHAKGVALWAGPEFEQAGRFEHANVHFLDFSPEEKYLVTYSPPTKRWEQVSDCLRVYDVATGALRRAFGSQQLDVSFGWPYLRWSFDDAFFAAANPRGFAVYESESFSMLDKKSIKVDDLRDFAWSPGRRTLGYWTGESGEIPARVALMRFPSKADVRSKNLFNVASATLHWQEQGDYLAVQVERYSRKKKKGQAGPEYAGLSYTIEVFHCREKDIPVDTLEVPEKTVAFAWEPTGNKFCVIYGNSPSTKTTVSFYKVQKEGTQLMKTLEPLRNVVNSILWAPAGGWVVLCSMGGSGGGLVFCDPNGPDAAIIMNDRAAHEGATHAVWDPTGRYLATSTSFWEGRTVDLGYRIWNFQGKELCRRPTDRFCSFQWRPRPKSNLSEESIKKVKKDLKSYSSKFAEEDRRDRGKASREVVERRQELANAFGAWRAAAAATLEEELPLRTALRVAHPDLVQSVLTKLPDSEMEEETVVMPLTREEKILERAPED